MKLLELKPILESLLFSSKEPLTIKKIQAALLPEMSANALEIKASLKALKQEYESQERAFELTEIAGGFLLQTRPCFSHYIQRLNTKTPKKDSLSPSILEVLAIIAYRQPITKIEIEAIRGVDCSYALNSLLEKGYICNEKKLEAPGNPSLYETTSVFLQVFGFKNLKELPPISEPSLTTS